MTVAGQTPVKGMSWIPGGAFAMGSDAFYPEERPARRAEVEGFWIDRHPITVAQFARFVGETGYVTVPERPLDPADYPDADPAALVPGSLVFHKAPGPVDLGDVGARWRYVPDAFWRAPEGPGSTAAGRQRHPVTHVAYEDAAAYARWAGKELPTEVEWERAARGGLEGKVFAWGDDLAPRGRLMANTWQGEFPWQNLCSDGYEGTSPVAAFDPNGYGLYDMAGNVWEWTSDHWSTHNGHAGEHACCAPAVPLGETTARRVIKGGSHLCSPNYCLRFRPAARQSEAVDTSTTHIGFRCVLRAPGPEAA